MSKKLQGNGLFESSRMMLPEHREAYHLYKRNLQKKSRPQLDEQELDRISMLITESMQLGKEIVLVLFHEINATERIGIVTKVNLQQKSIRFSENSNEDYRWINLSDIIDVRDNN